VIPRIFHRIWLGGSALPGEYASYGESWQRHHPGWEMRLWTDFNLPELVNPDAFQRGRNPAEKANVLRYELLLRTGGVYLDVDMECLRAIEPLLEGVSAFACRESDRRVGNAILGSVPGHPIMRDAVTEVARTAGTGRQLETSGPSFFTNLLERHPDVTVFPPELFYPLKFDDRLLPYPRSFPDAYAIHYWHHSWATREDLEAQIRRLQKQVYRLKADLEEVRGELERSRRERLTP
jgi:mannosyltransferase OCH1-like enzyme